MALNLKRLLEFEIQKEGHEAVVRAVSNAVSRRARELNIKVDDVLDRSGVRREYRTAVSLKESRVDDPDLLAYCIRRLELPLEWIFQVQPQIAPWDTWVPNDVAVVVVGERPVFVDKISEMVAQRAVGARDSEAQSSLVNSLQRDFRIDCRVELRNLPTALRPADAIGELDGIRWRKDVGAVIVVGSPFVNPLADPIARVMFDDLGPDELPARLRWCFDLEQPEPYLSEAEPCKPEAEGIRLKDHRDTTFRRVRDDEVHHRLANGDAGPFDDCGLLLVDARDRPLLILCAGHGGCATIATVYALQSQFLIQKKLAQSHDEKNAIVGKYRLFEVIWVKRRKPSTCPSDDLTFDRDIDEGWGFAF
jgi:hypothetical protein